MPWSKWDLLLDNEVGHEQIMFYDPKQIGQWAFGEDTQIYRVKLYAHIWSHMAIAHI